MLIFLCQGDIKGSARGGDVSVKELVGARLTNPQYAHLGSFTQGVNI